MGTITFGSFPRSGNHFLEHIFSKTLVDCRIVYLEHLIYPLAVEKNVVTTIRNPLECVPSWIVKMDDSRIDRAEKVLEWYVAYYEKVKQLDIVVLPFEQLVCDPLLCINYVYNKYGLKPLQSLDYDLSTGFYDPTKDKSEYDEIIQEMQLAPSFPRAMSLFEELCVPVG
jgi:hypothetical protein